LEIVVLVRVVRLSTIGNSKFTSEYYTIDALWLLELLGVLDVSGLTPI